MRTLLVLGIMILVLITPSLAKNAVNFLSRGQADTLYCHVDGTNCNITGGNITNIINNTIINTTGFNSTNIAFTNESNDFLFRQNISNIIISDNVTYRQNGSAPIAGLDRCSGDIQGSFFGNQYCDEGNGLYNFGVSDSDAICAFTGACFNNYDNITHYLIQGDEYSTGSTNKFNITINPFLSDYTFGINCSYSTNTREIAILQNETDMCYVDALVKGNSDEHIQLGNWIIGHNNQTNDLIFHDNNTNEKAIYLDSSANNVNFPNGFSLGNAIFPTITIDSDTGTIEADSIKTAELCVDIGETYDSDKCITDFNQSVDRRLDGGLTNLTMIDTTNQPWNCVVSVFGNFTCTKIT